MLRVGGISRMRPFLGRSYATATGPNTLIFLEHQNGVLDSGSLSALTAAQQLGGNVTGLVVAGPEHIKTVVEKAKQYVSSCIGLTSRPDLL